MTYNFLNQSYFVLCCCFTETIFVKFKFKLITFEWRHNIPLINSMSQSAFNVLLQVFALLWIAIYLTLFYKIVITVCTNFRTVTRHHLFIITSSQEYQFQYSYKDSRFLLIMLLTLLWRRSLSYRNQYIDLQSKLMDLFLYDRDLRHQRVKLSAEKALYSIS